MGNGAWDAREIKELTEELKLLSEWRRLLRVKEKALKDRGSSWHLNGIALGDDEHAKTWQKAYDRIYGIKRALFGTHIV